MQKFFKTATVIIVGIVSLAYLLAKWLPNEGEDKPHALRIWDTFNILYSPFVFAFSVNIIGNLALAKYVPSWYFVMAGIGVISLILRFTCVKESREKLFGKGGRNGTSE